MLQIVSIYINYVLYYKSHIHICTINYNNKILCVELYVPLI